MDDGLSDGQFLYVSLFSPSNNCGNRNTVPHYSLHHMQISPIQHRKFRILPIRVDAWFVQNQIWAEGVQQPGKVGPPLWIIQHVGEFKDLWLSLNANWVERLGHFNLPVERYSLSSSPSSTLMSRSLLFTEREFFVHWEIEHTQLLWKWKQCNYPVGYKRWMF